MRIWRLLMEGRTHGHIHVYIYIYITSIYTHTKVNSRTENEPQGDEAHEDLAVADGGPRGRASGPKARVAAAAARLHVHPPVCVGVCRGGWRG